MANYLSKLEDSLVTALVASTQNIVNNTQPVSLNPNTKAATELNQTTITRLKDAGIAAPWCDQYLKMISGMKSTCVGSEPMMTQRQVCFNLLHQINSRASVDLPGFDLEVYRHSRTPLFRQLLGKLGEGSFIEQPFYTQMGCNVLIGSKVYINRDCKFHDLAPIFIGDRTAIGSYVTFITEGHGTDIAARRAGLTFAHPIEVGNDCWIGAGVMIMPGVKIGDGCTIGAGSVVTKDIEPFSIAVGVPCKVIRKVADPDAAVVEAVRENDVAAR